MQDERSRLCRHIRAARDWLGQAEDSLQAEQDVRGDLKLLLARAELQHIQEKRKLKDMGRRFLFVVPVFLVFLSAVGFRLQEAAPAAPSTEKVLMSGDSQPETVPEHPPQAAPSVAEPQPAGIEKISEMNAPENLPEIGQIPAVPATADLQETVIPSEVEPEPSVQEVQEHAVPSRDMQKLMQSAGSVLRAQ